MHPTIRPLFLAWALAASIPAHAEPECEHFFAVEGRVLDHEGAPVPALVYGNWPLPRSKRSARVEPLAPDKHFRLEFRATDSEGACQLPETLNLVAMAEPGQYQSQTVHLMNRFAELEFGLKAPPAPSSWEDLAVELEVRDSKCASGTLLPDSRSELEGVRIEHSGSNAGITLYVWTDHIDTCHIPTDSARAYRHDGAITLHHGLACREPTRGEAVSYCANLVRLGFHLPDLSSVPEAVWLMDRPIAVHTPGP